MELRRDLLAGLRGLVAHHLSHGVAAPGERARGSLIDDADLGCPLDVAVVEPAAAEVAPEVSTPVDIVVGNISARTALNTICESIGCTWRANGTVSHVQKGRAGTIVVPRRVPGTRANEAEARSAGVKELRRLMDQALPADMKFEHAPLADVAARLSKATGFEIAFGGTRPGETFSGDLGGRPFSAALKVLAEQLEGTVATITIAGRKGTSTSILKVRVGAVRKPRK